MRVLVIDDTEAVRRLLGVLLPLSGHQVVGEAADGASGVEQARRLRPDAVVVDGHMPVMGGWEAAGVIHRTVPRTRIVMFSADDPPRTGEEGDIDAFVAKLSGADAVVDALSALETAR